MSGSYKERKKDPDFILDEFPEELNPELYKTSFDWEAEERRLKGVDKKNRKEAAIHKRLIGLT